MRFTPGRPFRRTRALLAAVALLALLMVALVVLAGLWTDLLWYRSVHYSSVFDTVLRTKITLFCVFGALMALIVGANMFLAYRTRPPLGAMDAEQCRLDRYRTGLAPYRAWALTAAAGTLGVIAGGSATLKWRLWLAYAHATPFHTKDPQFHKDVSFYTFDLPWYRFLLAFGFGVVALSLVAAALVHYLYGGLRTGSPGARATSAASGHLAVLLGLFVSLKAVAYWLDRYSLAVKSHGGEAAAGWTGLRYVDANAYLPAKTILCSIAVICAVLFFATVKLRTWTLPTVGFGLMLLSAILIGGLYPAIVQKFQVEPHQAAKEAPYLQRTIDATRTAFGLDHTVESEYRGASTASNARLRADAATAASIRLLDPDVASAAFQQAQRSRGYYAFPSALDVDRYPVDGKEQDTVVGVRELNVKGIPKSDWINEHFTYTHGYGLAAAKATEVTGTGSGGAGRSGQPVYIESAVPASGTLGAYPPQVYYGERTTQWSVVDGPTKELDYADTTHEATTSYHGKGGVGLSDPLTRAAYAVTFGEPKLMDSAVIGRHSQILYNRTPTKRVEAVAPWLTTDEDPYPAVVGKRLVWIVDAYTTSANYPGSARTTLGGTTAGGHGTADRRQVNYVRNSVKATVDAYSGKVTLYQWDTGDPVLRTWMKAFPHTVRPKSAIPAALKAHLRYPQDLFTAQRRLLTRYHVTTAAQFTRDGEAWRLADDPATGSGKAAPPYYLSLTMPGQSGPRFSLTAAFALDKAGDLAAFAAVDSDATSPDYGTIRLLEAPTDDPVDGPRAAQGALASDSAYARQISHLRVKGAVVRYGDLLTVPLDGGLLYVEPVYVRGAGSDVPLLKKVFVDFGGRTALDDTLDQALDHLFGRAGAPAPSTASKGRGASGPGTAATADLAKAQRAYDDAQKALDTARERLEKAQTRTQAQAKKAAAAQGPDRARSTPRASTVGQRRTAAAALARARPARGGPADPAPSRGVVR